jgi:hypothetical protein
MDLDVLFRDSLRDLLHELIDGPPIDIAFILNPGDRGLRGTLARLSSAQASARPSGRSSVAAHVEHLRYGFSLLNRWSRGEDPFADADYLESWDHQQVTDEEWNAVQGELDREVRAWMDAFGETRMWDPVQVSGAISSVAHLAYHVGAIRQLASA